MKKSFSTTVLALLLAVSLLVGIMPISTLAEDTPIFYVGTETQWTGKPSSQVYASPQDAIDDAAAWSAANDDAQTYVLVTVGEYIVTASLSLKNGVTVIGGFAGTESGTTPTYAQNDDPNATTTNTVFSGNNSTRVFDNIEINATAMLQNVIITKGSAVGGGGMRNDNSDPTITNCAFTENIADNNGGGMRNNNSSPTLANCTFADNQAASIGGGMSNFNSNPTLMNCMFADNIASIIGGGIYNTNSSATITNCIFRDNEAPDGPGGGICNDGSSSPTIEDCTFIGNTAYGGGGISNNGSGNVMLVNCTFAGNSAVNGGGIFNNYNSPTLIGCIFTGNNAATDGGGIFNYFCQPLLINCAFVENTTSARGGGIFNDDSSSPTIVNCTFTGNVARTGSGICNFLNCKTTLINCLMAFNNGNNAPDDNIYVGLSTLAAQSSVIGTSWYNGEGVKTLAAQTPAARDFAADGSLTEHASYAIGQGDYALYVATIAKLNTKHGTSFAPVDMRDGKGKLVVNASSQIDIGAFRYGAPEAGVMVASPTLASKTTESITVNAVTAPVNGQSAEYAISTNGTAPTNGWATALTFASLTPNKIYYIFARSAANDDYYAGAASAALVVKTDKTVDDTTRGDANCDGKINAADAAAILRWIVRLDKLSEQGYANALLTGGEVPTAADAARILRWIVKLETVL